MLIGYIHAAMRRAEYEMLADNEGFVGTIPGFRGLIGHGQTLELCREDLHGALQSWLVLKLRDGDDDVPVINKINLTSAGKVARKLRSRASEEVA